MAAHLELSRQMTDMFHLKLLINLAPLSIAGQIDWHASQGHDRPVRWCPSKARRELGICSARSLLGVDHCVHGVNFFSVDIN